MLFSMLCCQKPLHPPPILQALHIRLLVGRSINPAIRAKSAYGLLMLTLDKIDHLPPRCGWGERFVVGGKFPFFSDELVVVGILK